jgi:predicted secreted protein
MSWTSIVAIYALFWVMTAFVILPIGVRTHEELGLAKVPGQADSAPGNFQPRIIILRTTLLSAALFGLYYANYVYGWVDRHSFDWLINRPV